MRIYCFGGFRIETESKRGINFCTDKTRALLVYLAVESGRPFRRSHLAGLLWSEQSEEQALHNLRQTLSLLRKAWDSQQNDSPLLIADRDTVQINPEVDVWVDVNAFQVALKEAYQHFQNYRDLGKINIVSLTRAVSLFTNPFLDRFDLNNSPLFDEWVLTEREKTNHEAVQALNLVCEYYERRGEYSLAERCARRIVELTPWDESAHALVMQLLAIDQNWSASQNQFIQLREYLKKNLDVTPDPGIVALYQQIRSAALNNRPFPPRYPVSVHNFPVTNSEFVGRVREISAITTLLNGPETRLVSVIGLGGIGKTRLAIEIGRIHVGIYKNGVFFIPLLNTVLFEAFQSAIAKGIGLLFSDNSPPQTQLLDYLREKQALLIFDNFEQLLNHPQNLELLIDILHTAPQVKILVTSRERLNLHEEYIFVLDGLNYPIHPAMKGLNPLSYEAMLLFEKRAQKYNQNFRLEADNVEPISKICSLMEGHPLGIELIVSSAWRQTWGDLLSEIETGIHEVAAQVSNAPPQHKNLRVVFDTSWHLLTQQQQDVLCRLSVFGGGFTAAAAAAVGEASSSILADLTAKSLLRMNSTGWFDFHEIVRQFSAEKLNQSDQLDQTLERHAGYFVRLLQGYSASSDYSNQQEVLSWMDQEFDNIRIAWNHLLEKRAIPEIRSCVEILYQFFNIRSRFTEGIGWFQSTIDSLAPFPPNDLVCGMLQSRIGSLALRARDNELADKMLSSSFEIFSILGHQGELAFCLIGLGGFYLRKKDYARAQHCAQQSLAAYQGLNDEKGQSYALYLIGLILSRVGNYSEAKAALRQALSFSRRVGDQRRLIAPLNVLGDIACTEGTFDEAEALFLEGLEISRVLNDRYNQAIILNNLATIYQVRQEYAKEDVMLRGSLEICRDIGDLDGEAVALNNLGEMAVVLGQYHEAIEYSREALRIARQLEEDWTIIICLNNLGEAYFGLKEYARAKDYFVSAIQRSYRIEAWDMLGRVIVNAAPIYTFDGENRLAVDLFKAAMAHPAVEFQYRQKASSWLEQMGAGIPMNKDEQLLPDLVNKLYMNPPDGCVESELDFLEKS